MSKENYKISGTVSGGSLVVKRSPSVSGRKQSKTLGDPVLGKNGLRKSMSQNINSLNKVLTESERILPRTHNTMTRKNG